MGISNSYYCDLEMGRRDWNTELLSQFDAVAEKLKERKNEIKSKK